MPHRIIPVRSGTRIRKPIIHPAGMAVPNRAEANWSGVRRRQIVATAAFTAYFNPKWPYREWPLMLSGVGMSVPRTGVWVTISLCPHWPRYNSSASYPFTVVPCNVLLPCYLPRSVRRLPERLLTRLSGLWSSPSERASDQSVIGSGSVNKSVVRLVCHSVRQDEVVALSVRVGRGPVGRRRAGPVRLQRGRLQRLLPQHELGLQDHVPPRHEHVLPSLQTLLPQRAEIHAVHSLSQKPFLS